MPDTAKDPVSDFVSTAADETFVPLVDGLQLLVI